MGSNPTPSVKKNQTVVRPEQVCPPFALEPTADSRSEDASWVRLERPSGFSAYAAGPVVRERSEDRRSRPQLNPTPSALQDNDLGHSEC